MEVTFVQSGEREEVMENLETIWLLCVTLPLVFLCVCCWLIAGNIVFDYLGLDKELAKFERENSGKADGTTIAVFKFLMKAVYVVTWPWPLFSCLVQRLLGSIK